MYAVRPQSDIEPKAGAGRRGRSLIGVNADERHHDVSQHSTYSIAMKMLLAENTMRCVATECSVEVVTGAITPERRWRRGGERLALHRQVSRVERFVVTSAGG